MNNTFEKNGNEIEDKLIDLLHELTEEDWQYIVKNYSNRCFYNNEKFSHISIKKGMIHFVYTFWQEALQYDPGGWRTICVSIALRDLLNDKYKNNYLKFGDFLTDKFGGRFTKLVLEVEKESINKSIADYDDELAHLNERVEITEKNKQNLVRRKAEIGRELSALDGNTASVK